MVEALGDRYSSIIFHGIVGGTVRPCMAGHGCRNGGIEDPAGEIRSGKTLCVPSVNTSTWQYQTIHYQAVVRMISFMRHAITTLKNMQCI